MFKAKYKTLVKINSIFISLSIEFLLFCAPFLSVTTKISEVASSTVRINDLEHNEIERFFPPHMAKETNKRAGAWL